MDVLLGFSSGIILLYVLMEIYKTKGIYNPVYPLVLSIFILMADYVIKICLIVNATEYDDYTLALITVTALHIGLVYCLCKFLLPQVDNRQIRKTSSGINYTVVAVLLLLVTIVYLILNTGILYTFFTYEYPGIIAFMCVYISICLLISIWPIVTTLIRYDKIKHEVNRTLSSLKTHRAPIIILRSFELDKYPVLGKTFDEYLCQNFSLTAQPVISLSDPDSFLPTGGSIKIQSYDSKWKDVIITMFKNCRAVVIFEGKSEGLHWEISQLKEYLTPDKLFVVTPPQRFRMRAWYQCYSFSIWYYSIFSGKNVAYVLNYVWNKFAEHLNKEGIRLTTCDPGGNRIFTFSDTWTAVNDGYKSSSKNIFEYIMNNTIQYEMGYYDYSAIAGKLSDYELSQKLNSLEKNRIVKGTAAIACLELLIMLILLLF